LCLAVLMAFVLAACGGGGGGGSAAAASDVVASPDDFPGHSIGVQTGTTAAQSIEELYPDGADDVEVRSYRQILQCFEDLSLGRIDAVYVDSVVSGYYTAGDDGFVRSWLSDEPEPMGICFLKEQTDLAAAVEAAIDTMYADGTMDAIAEANFGDTEGFVDVRNVAEAPEIPGGFTTLEEGKLKVGMEVGYPPMEYLAEDGLTEVGFDVDVANKIGELLGLEVEFENTSFDGIFAGLEKGSYDCIISAVSINEERQEKYLLTEPYVANRLSIVVKSEG
jgi:ABC-type amino acid transport substrate-binding protein